MKKYLYGGILAALAALVAGGIWIANGNNGTDESKTTHEPSSEAPKEIAPTTQKKTADETKRETPKEIPETPQEEPQTEETADLLTAEPGSPTWEALPPALRIPIPPGYERYGKIAYTRQGNPYRINPDWHNDPEVLPQAVEAALAKPTGPPLTFNWADKTTISKVDWTDPRVWESYRNFWGFDKPSWDADGKSPYRARLDNWGAPLQKWYGVALVTHYTTQKGFRPSPEQLEQYMSLEEAWRREYIDGDAATARALHQEMQTLIANAQGDIPVSHSYETELTAPSSTLDEEVGVLMAEGIRNLYIRLGIEHLYEFYETTKYDRQRRSGGVW